MVIDKLHLFFSKKISYDFVNLIIPKKLHVKKMKVFQYNVIG